MKKRGLTYLVRGVQKWLLENAGREQSYSAIYLRGVYMCIYVRCGIGGGYGIMSLGWENLVLTLAPQQFQCREQCRNINIVHKESGRNMSNNTNLGNLASRTTF
jgi:hypothetical protein